MKRSQLKITGLVVSLVILWGLGFWLLKSKTPQEPDGAVPVGSIRAPGTLGLDSYRKRPIGKTTEGNSWITDLLIVDLDGDGLKDVIVCDGQASRVSWIRQVRLREFVEEDIGEPIS